MKPSRGDRRLGYSSRHTQVPVPATTAAVIDRDGTILSTSTDAEELEAIIKKALNIKPKTVTVTAVTM